MKRMRLALLPAAILIATASTPSRAEVIDSKTDHGCLAVEGGSQTTNRRSGAARFNVITVSDCPASLYKWVIGEEEITVATQELGRLCLTVDRRNPLGQGFNVVASDDCRGARTQDWTVSGDLIYVSFGGENYCLDSHHSIAYRTPSGAEIRNVYALPCHGQLNQQWVALDNDRRGRTPVRRRDERSAGRPNARCLYDDGRGSGETHFPFHLTSMDNRGSFRIKGAGIADNGIAYELTVDEDRPRIAYGLARTDKDALQLGIFVREKREEACWRGRRFDERICAW